jgi:hypothetical protein
MIRYKESRCENTCGKNFDSAEYERDRMEMGIGIYNQIRSSWCDFPAEEKIILGKLKKSLTHEISNDILLYRLYII